LVVTVLVVPLPTEADKGFGFPDVTPLFRLFVGTVLSILIALFAAILVVVHVRAKGEPKRREPGAPADGYSSSLENEHGSRGRC
jgi:hypothetical protein